MKVVLETRYSDPNKTSFAVGSDFTHASATTVAPDSGARCYSNTDDATNIGECQTPQILTTMAKTQNEVIAELLKNGAKSENVKVKNTKVKVLDKYTLSCGA